MKEIKFRGRRIDNGMWVYGGFHKHLKVTPSPVGARKPREDDYAYLIIESGFSDWDLPKPIEAHAVDPNTVGQFTGLSDKNDVPIYKGDIVRLANDNLIGGKCQTWQVGWGFDGWVFRNTPNSPAISCPSFYSNAPLMEVIGNIYEHPPLLEGVTTDE